MRLFAVLVLPATFLLLAASSSLRSQDKDKTPPQTPYYPLQVGNTWEYRTGEKDKYVVKVTKNDKFEDVPCAYVDTLVDGKVIGTEYLNVTADGVYRQGFSKQKANMPVLILKLPPKADDKWAVNVKIKDEVLRGTFTTREDKVKVPAGEFKTFAVESKDLEIGGLKGTITTHYAEDVGMVKQSLQIGTAKTEIELEKFTKGK
jgi:hypothetical protein